MKLARPVSALAFVAALCCTHVLAQGTPSSRYEVRNGSGITRWEPPASGAGQRGGVGQGLAPGGPADLGTGRGTSTGAWPVSGVGVGAGTTMQEVPGGSAGLGAPGGLRPGDTGAGRLR